MCLHIYERRPEEAPRTAPGGEPFAQSGVRRGVLLLSTLLKCWPLTTRMYSSITSVIKTKNVVRNTLNNFKK